MALLAITIIAPTPEVTVGGDTTGVFDTCCEVDEFCGAAHSPCDGGCGFVLIGGVAKTQALVAIFSPAVRSIVVVDGAAMPGADSDSLVMTAGGGLAEEFDAVAVLVVCIIAVDGVVVGGVVGEGGVGV